MIRDDGLVKVLDFGLAKLTAQTSGNTASEASTRAQLATNPGMILGTVTYMSPEQARGQEVDARTDIFSFGVVLYEMLTGLAPFAGDTTSDVIAAILKTEPAPLAESVPDIPKDLDRIVNKALRKDREERYQHIKDLLIDLRDLKNDLDFETKFERVSALSKNEDGVIGRTAAVTEIQNAQTTSSAEYLTNEIKKRKRGIALASLILLMSLGGIVFWYFNSSVANATQIRSIAVLPLENLSGDPAQDYFADGMTEALISDLSQIHAFTKVISRTSVMSYKGSRSKSLPEIAAELKVDAVIEGTVQRSGGRVHVTARLIPAAADSPVWSYDYDRDMSDVLKLQSDVARAVADEIRIHVTVEESARLGSARQVDPAAQEEYLLGRYYSWKFSEEDLKRGIEHLERATQLAPDYAPAYAELSDAWRTRGVLGGKTFREVEAPARAAALKAVELDPKLAEGHLNLANLKYIYDWDWFGAEDEMKRAVELNPNSMNAHYAYAYLLMALGRFPEAVTHIKLTAQLDPTSSLVQVDVGRILTYDRKYDEAIEHLNRALELDAGNDFAHSAAYACLADIYEQTGKYAEAIASLEKAEALQPDYWVYKAQKARVYAKTGRRAEALRMLEEYKIKVGPSRFSKIGLAEIYSVLGENDEAFKSLTNVIEERDQLTSFLKIDTSFEGLHSDPRWKEVLRRMNFPPEKSY